MKNRGEPEVGGKKGAGPQFLVVRKANRSRGGGWGGGVGRSGRSVGRRRKKRKPECRSLEKKKQTAKERRGKKKSPARFEKGYTENPQGRKGKNPVPTGKTSRTREKHVNKKIVKASADER